ncbi:uncharacterized protein O9250_011665 isoform 1-T1 [Rhynochetos jubatus]
MVRSCGDIQRDSDPLPVYWEKTTDPFPSCPERPCPLEETTAHSSLREQAGGGEYQLRAWAYPTSAWVYGILLTGHRPAAFTRRRADGVTCAVTTMFSLWDIPVEFGELCQA